MSKDAEKKQQVFTAPATGRLEVDSLLSGVFWSSDGVLSRPSVLTYDFVAPDGPQSPLPMSFTEWMRPDYGAITPEFKAVILNALNHISDLTTLSFVQEAEGAGSNITFGVTQTPAGSVTGPVAYAMKPRADGDEVFVWLNGWVPYNYETAAFGNDVMLTVLHEMGHALGLRHPHDQDVGYGFAHDMTQDSEAFSIMSYRAYLGANSREGSVERKPLSYMVNDIAALQYLYGHNMQTRRNDDVYQFTDDIVYQTIWDAGGHDTISWAGKLTSAHINLQPGTLSYFGGVDERSDPKTWLAGSGLLGIAFECEIENAEGGHENDRLIGNTLDNSLRGGSGKDVLVASLGQDVLDGGIGRDTADYSQLEGTLSVRLAGDKETKVILNGQDKDTLRRIENVTGGQSSDVLMGDDGNNVINGNGGNDVLAGYGGEDILGGGQGKDRLRGGEGADTFVYRSWRDSPAQNGARDIIVDFQGAEGDRIDMSSVDTRHDIDGVQVPTFSSIGSQPYAIWYEVQSRGGRIQVDTSGDSLPNLSIDIEGEQSITQDDFILVKGPTVEEASSTLDALLPFQGMLSDLPVTQDEDWPGFPAYRTAYGTKNDDLLEGGVSDNKFGSTLGHDIIHGRGGSDTMSYEGEPLSASVTLRGEEPASVTLGGHAKDTLHNIENITGGRGDDALIGDQNANFFIGKEGNDHLSGEGGDDGLAGESGADRLIGGLGNDILDGGAGHDIADYGHHTEMLHVVLRGPLWGVVDVGASEEDHLIQIEEFIAGSGDDVLTVWGQGSTITGGAGADSFTFKSMPKGISSSSILLEENVIYDFDRQEGDHFDLSGWNLTEWVAVWSDAGPQSHAVWVEEDGNDSLLYMDHNGDANADTVVRLKDIQTMLPEDVLLASETPETLDLSISSLAEKTSSIVVDLEKGTFMVDGQIHTVEPVQTLVTGSGGDLIAMSPSIDTDVVYIDTGDEVDRVGFSRVRQPVEVFLKGSDWGFAIRSDGVVWRMRNVENIIGTPADDYIVGDGRDNMFAGFHGRDVLDGAGGGDALNYAYSGQGISVTLARDQWAEVHVGGQPEDKVRNIESIIGSRGDDHVIGDADDNTYVWAGGSNTFDGQGGKDAFQFFNASSGVSIALQGDQWITVDLQGHTNRMRNVESVTGSTAHDYLFGDARDNILSGSMGDDWLQGGLGDDILIGHSGQDTADYSDRSEAIAVTLHQNYTAVVFVDGRAEDRLRSIENINGGAGDDRLSGDALSNKISGGGGRDLLGGGGGTDYFVWGAVSESTPELQDTVTDFRRGETGRPGDQLDLSAIDADPTIEGCQALAFSKQTAQAHAVWYHVNDEGRFSTLYADTSGDLQPEFSILLRGVATLSAGDLIL